jgi:hypothetical protein
LQNSNRYHFVATGYITPVSAGISAVNQVATMLPNIFQSNIGMNAGSLQLPATNNVQIKFPFNRVNDVQSSSSMMPISDQGYIGNRFNMFSIRRI